MGRSSTRRPYPNPPCACTCSCPRQAASARLPFPSPGINTRGNTRESRAARATRSRACGSGERAGEGGGRMGTGAVTLHQARFAHRHELKGLLHKTPAPDGVLLGVRRDFLLFKRFVAVRPTKTRREIGNTLIVGPTRSGKGLLATSQLLSWKHSAVVNDIKGELFTATAGYRATLGEVYVIDPTGIGHCFDPLEGKHTEDAFLSAAKHLLYQPDERDKVFTQRAIGMLSRLFTAAKIEGLAPFPYVRSLIRSSLKSCAKRLNAIDPALATRFLYADFQDANFENKFLVSSWETLTAWLEPLLTETVIRSLTHSDFTAEHILRGDRPVTV